MVISLDSRPWLLLSCNISLAPIEAELLYKVQGETLDPEKRDYESLDDDIVDSSRMIKT